jgi:hypothetical protein
MKSLKNIKWILLFLLVPTISWAQKQERQVGDTAKYKTLIPEEKQGLLKNVSVIANMNFALRNEFVDKEYTQTRFRNEQFRLEVRGQVHEKVYFRFRDRYTRAQTSESIDNLSRSVDLAYLRFDLTPQFSISAGKMCADWGAWEFDGIRSIFMSILISWSMRITSLRELDLRIPRVQETMDVSGIGFQNQIF